MVEDGGRSARFQLDAAAGALILGLALASDCALAEFQIGDTAVVVHDTHLKVGDKVVQDVPRGVGLRIQAVQGEWLWVSNETAGWVHQRDVAAPTKAIEIFTEQIRKDHDDSDAYVRRGLAYYDEHEFNAAIIDLNEAIRLDPVNASAYSSRAICRWARREVDEAIADFSEAIRLDPKEPMYLANRGILWNMKGESDKAIADADAALHLSPRFITAHIVRGNAQVRKHAYAGAIADFGEALKINPRDATAFALRGRAWAEKGDNDRAHADFHSAVGLSPNDKNVCNEIARFFATCPDAGHRDGRKAVEYARQACEISRWRWASSISVLAASYAELGDFEQAVKWQEKATGMVTGKRHDEFRTRLGLFKAHKPLRQELQKETDA